MKSTCKVISSGSILFASFSCGDVRLCWREQILWKSACPRMQHYAYCILQTPEHLDVSSKHYDHTNMGPAKLESRLWQLHAQSTSNAGAKAVIQSTMPAHQAPRSPLLPSPLLFLWPLSSAALPCAGSTSTNIIESKSAALLYASQNAATHSHSLHIYAHWHIHIGALWIGCGVRGTYSWYTTRTRSTVIFTAHSQEYPKQQDC